ncbi:MAG: B12-binding domain-containing radical SAM protein [Candidatus Sumerlaeaceae bacterium]|nr:B12-binding domain-containing radical SAM protein [Candidatus Sumerlaeaceae bacterium]
MARALLLVPWIFDFAAYDFWSCPVGLLSLGGLLRGWKWDVDYVDLTDRHHPLVAEHLRERTFHTGKYYAEEVPKPPVLQTIPRRYKRYGLPPDIAADEIAALDRPDVVLLTSRMTYWYPGVREAIGLCRQIWGNIPIILGGTYAPLCWEHARSHSGATLVFRGEAEEALRNLLEQILGWAPCTTADIQPRLANLDTLPYPAWELRRWNKALVVETSRGCPYSCTYCATGRLLPHWRAKSPSRVADEIDYAVGELGAEDIAFADDALLLNAESHFLIWAKEIERRNIRVRFHTPNSLFANMITPQVAEAMRNIGFRTIRVSLETANDSHLEKMNRRIRLKHFREAMKNLRAVGYGPSEIGVYILCGLPGQTRAEVRESIDVAIGEGGTPRLAEFSPIPGTAEWKWAIQATSLPLEEEPLLQNNSIYWWLSGSMTPEELAELKRYALRQSCENPRATDSA